MENILEVKGVGKNFGGFTALSDVNLSIRKGERLGLIGPNGSGKTTLISCISGALQNDGGTIRFMESLLKRFPLMQERAVASPAVFSIQGLLRA